MENSRIALVSIIVEDTDSTAEMNAVLHAFAPYIIGRMGIPYREREVALVSVAMDAPMEVINAMTGKLGRLSGIKAKAVCSKNMQK